jgi:hypothetical protein
MANRKSLDTLYNFIQAKRAKGYSYLGFPVYDTSKNDLNKLGQISDKYGFPVEWLANLINHESAGTFNPAIKNSIGATGLIQFLPSTALNYGVTANQLAQMNFSQQLDYVDMYLERGLKNKKMLDENGKVIPTFNQTDLFMLIFYPVSVGDPTFLFPQYVQNANGGIKTPQEYTQKALRNPPFPLESYPSSYKEFLQRFGDISGEGFLNPNRKWWVVPTIVVTFGVITTMIVYIYKKRKNG